MCDRHCVDEDRDLQDQRFRITGSNPYAGSHELARKWGDYRGMSRQMSSALTSMALLVVAGVAVVVVLAVLLG